MRTGWNKVAINGRAQWVSVRGADEGPVLLFLHGGPGGSEFGARRRYLGRLERTWCVVDWEQPGAGRSYRGDETAADLSVEALTLDGVALVRMLGGQFGARPLVLVGHSFGTVLGARIAAGASPGVSAYVGVSQVVNWALQEERSYEWALAEARRTGYGKAEAALVEIGRPVDGQYASGTSGTTTQRRWLGALGGIAADPRFLARWMLSIFTARHYPITAKLRYTKALSRSMDMIWPALCQEVNLARDVTEFSVPVHLFAGGKDRITDLAQIEDWFQVLRAPAKHLEVVEDVGHLNLYEAPERFISFLDGVRVTRR